MEQGDQSVYKVNSVGVKEDTLICIAGGLIGDARVPQVTSRFGWFVPCLLLLWAIWPEWAVAADEVAQHSPAEQFVMKKVAAGEEADFSKSPWQGEQRLRSLFLEKLLTGQTKNSIQSDQFFVLARAFPFKRAL